MVLGDKISKWKTLRSQDFESDEWVQFQTQVFPYRRINLNPSTFGSPSIYCQKAYDHFLRGDLEAYPLRLYEKGREEIARARSLAQRLWGSAHHYLNISQSSSQVQNLLMLNLMLFFYQKKKKQPPFTVLTTKHEHAGGEGFFVSRKEIDLEYLSENEIQNQIHFKNRVEKLKPDIFFSSHLAYNTGFEFPIDEWSAMVKKIIPECIVVIDYAQSLGLLEIKPSREVDFSFASSHKWLMGPYGLGFLWVSRSILPDLNAIQWNGETLDPAWVGSGFETKGGHSFALYASLTASLLLHSAVGVDIILRRSHELLGYLMSLLNDVFIHLRVSVEYSSRLGFLSPHEFLAVKDYAGYFSIHFKTVDPYPLYHYLNKRSVHVKCIKKANTQLLRIGVPYYETKERLKKMSRLVEEFFENKIDQSSL